MSFIYLWHSCFFEEFVSSFRRWYFQVYIAIFKATETESHFVQRYKPNYESTIKRSLSTVSSINRTTTTTRININTGFLYTRKVFCIAFRTYISENSKKSRPASQTIILTHPVNNVIFCQYIWSISISFYYLLKLFYFYYIIVGVVDIFLLELFYPLFIKFLTTSTTTTSIALNLTARKIALFMGWRTYNVKV